MKTIGRARHTAGIALALVAFASSLPASAQEHGTRTQVRFADLDLTRQDGLDRLDARLRIAVREVCGRLPAQGATEMRDIRRCRHDTWDTIEPQREIAIAIANGRSGSVYLARADGIEVRVTGTY